MNLPRLLLTGCLAGVAGLLAVGEALSFAAPSPEDAAKASAIGKGWRGDQMSFRGLQMKNSPLGGTAHVQFDAHGPDGAKVIRVDLARPALSKTWRVSAYREGE